MSSLVLTLKDLHHLDNGKANAAVNHALRQCVQDIIDRPGDKAKRKVMLTVEMTPKLDEDLGALDTVHTQFIIKSSIPVRRTVEYPMLASRDGRLLFSRNSPMDPRQNDLPYAGDESAVDMTTGEVQDEDDGPEIADV